MSLDTTSSKNILLIIDPQNDFSEANSNQKRGAGALAVTGSNEDYKRIIELINNFSFDEIHVSLDTHTPEHIGHSRFYEGGTDKNNYGFNFFNKRDHIPKKVPSFYTEKYNNAHKEARGSDFMIWNDHCLEDTEGHKIVEELHDVLKAKKNVKYHIKGQNELSEMYSIFSATVDPKTILNTNLQVFLNYIRRTQTEKKQLEDIKDGKLYSGQKKGNYDKAIGCTSYKDAADSLNLDTTRNDGLLENLFGANNKIYVCGQARTHCVKDSVKDMLNYAKEKGKNTENVVLIHNCSSPIAPENGGVYDIIEILHKNNGSLIMDYKELTDELKLPTGLVGHDNKFKGTAPQTGGKRRRTRKRSKRKRTQRKQKRSQRKKTRRSRR